MTIDQALDQAFAFRAAGRPADAEKLCRQVLAVDADHPDALHLLGMLMHDAKRPREAVELLNRAIAADPQASEFHAALCLALQALNRLDEAAAAARQAIACDPTFAPAYCALGAVLHPQNKNDEALAALTRSVQLQDDLADGWSNLAVVLHALGRLDEAIAAGRNAVARDPNNPQAYNNLGNALMSRGLEDEAIACYRRQIELNPNQPEPYNNLANALMKRGQTESAAELYRRAIALDPRLADAWNNLGRLLRDQGHLQEAAHCHRQAISIQPNNAQAHCELGHTLSAQGRADEAIAAHRHAIALRPEFREAWDALLYMLHFSADYDAEQILAEHRNWEATVIAPLNPQLFAHVAHGRGDRLKLGYISPYFRGHVVGRNLLPVFANHDRSNFEIFCYSDVRREDAATRQLQSHGDRWRSIASLSDADAAQLIHDDRIDVLIDLGAHLAGNRMGVMARKPAPVQAAHLACAATTGLSAIDYRFTDPHLDPPGRHDAFNVERLTYLPASYWCYQPGTNDPDVAPLPMLSARHVTFGSLNSIYKVTPAAIDLWCRAMQAVSASRMILHARGDRAEHHYLLNEFARRQVQPERITLIGDLPFEQYLAVYHHIDIALDTLPYTGHMTSLDSFWMGVPVITLEGKTSVARGGVSILRNLEMDDLIARTPEEFITIAATLSTDPSRLGGLRTDLRRRLLASPIMDAKGYTRGLETAILGMQR